jgi:hypothetical protein
LKTILGFIKISLGTNKLLSRQQLEFIHNQEVCTMKLQSRR